MPIKKYKPLSPDPFINKIKGDTEFARLAHLNDLVDQTNKEINNIVPPGGGGTNPTSTYIPYNNAGTFDDSILHQDSANKTLWTLGTNSPFDPSEGILISYDSAARFMNLGGMGVGSNTNIYIDWNVGQIAAQQGSYTGFNLDIANSTYYFGDGLTFGGSWFGMQVNASNDLSIGDMSAGSGNGTKFILDDANSIIKTQYGGIDQGLALNFAGNTYEFGYLNGGSNETRIAVFDGEILTKWHGLFRGFDMVMPDQTYYIGSLGPSPNFYIELSNEQTNPFQHLKLIRNSQVDGLNIDFVNNIYQFGNIYSSINGFYQTSIGNISDGVYMDITGDSSSGTCIMRPIDASSGQDILFHYENDGNEQYFKFGYFVGNQNYIIMGSDNGQDMIMNTVINGTGKGFELNGSANNYIFGDLSSEYLFVDGANSTTTVFTQSFQLNDNGSGNLLTASAGGNSGQHLIITINATNYKIALLNA